MSKPKDTEPSVKTPVSILGFGHSSVEVEENSFWSELAVPKSIELFAIT